MAKKAKDDNVKPESTFDGLAAAIREDKSATVRDAAAKAFGDIARVRTDMRAAVPALTAAMTDESMEVRANAAQCLGRIGRDASSAVDNLMAALLDKKGDRFSRGYSAIALVRVDPSDDRIPPALGEVVGDVQVPKGVREDAARALALLMNRAAPAVPTLAKVLSDKDPDVRQGAAAALAAVGPAASAALPAMRSALETEKEKGIRAQIIFALGTVGKDDPKVVESLRNALKDDNAEIILATIRALAAIGPAAKETLPALKTFTTDGRTEIREAAKDAIEKIQENP
jgi:HEAT repeat protein